MVCSKVNTYPTLVIIMTQMSCLSQLQPRSILIFIEFWVFFMITYVDYHLCVDYQISVQILTFFIVVAFQGQPISHMAFYFHLWSLEGNLLFSTNFCKLIVSFIKYSFSFNGQTQMKTIPSFPQMLHKLELQKLNIFEIEICDSIAWL